MGFGVVGTPVFSFGGYLVAVGVCPECGRVYVAGGETNTTIKYPNETNPYQQERKSQDAADLTGARIDTRK